jgi:hypothetical protein
VGARGARCASGRVQRLPHELSQAAAALLYAQRGRGLGVDAGARARHARPPARHTRHTHATHATHTPHTHTHKHTHTHTHTHGQRTPTSCHTHVHTRTPRAPTHACALSTARRSPQEARRVVEAEDAQGRRAPRAGLPVDERECEARLPRRVPSPPGRHRCSPLHHAPCTMLVCTVPSPMPTPMPSPPHPCHTRA